MSYLNAVKQGTPTTPPAQQPEKPLPAGPPVEDLEEVLDEVEVLREDNLEEEDTQYEEDNNNQISFVRGKRNTGDFARIELEKEVDEDTGFWTLLVILVGPSGLCSFGLTCTYFYEKLLSNDDWWNLVEYQLPPLTKPLINILVEVAFPSNTGEKILTLPISTLKQPYQKQNVANYWFQILTKAADKSKKDKDKKNNDSPLNLEATLNGGFNIETGTGKNTQLIVYLEDLRVVHSLLHAIRELINRKHQVKLPYRNGNIILSLYGRGGDSISLHVISPGKESIKTIFPLEDFANQCRKAAKKFVSLVGTCHVIVRRPSNELIDLENWIKNQLEHNCLNQDVIFIKKSLASGLVKGSHLPAHFEKKILISKKKQSQDQIENSDIMELIIENLPEHYEEATKAAERLHEAATEQRETERQERQTRRDREKLEALEAKKRLEEAKKYTLEETSGGGGETWGEQIIPPPKKPKTKVVTLKDSEGWFNTTVVDEAGKELEKPKAEEKAFEKHPKPKKQQQPSKSNDSTLSNNIFTITNEMENLPSPSEYQSTLRENKLKGQQEKPTKNKTRKQVENKENGEKAKESVDTKKSADKIKKPKEEKKKEKPKEEKKKGPHQAAVKDVPFWQNDTFKPLVYVFAFVALISVLYLTLN